MRVLLVGPDYEANLSLQYLASSLRLAGHEPAIVAFNTAADAPEVLKQARGAQLVGLSLCFQVRASEFLDLAEALKDSDAARPVIAGGHYASCAAEDLLRNHRSLDLVVVHEGERTLVELADLGPRLLSEAASVPGLVVRREGLPWRTPPRPTFEPLDDLPRPDRSGPARLLCGVPTAYLMGSRGCVSSCDYCCITTLHRLAPGRRFRQRTPEDVADEMADLYRARGVRQFVFHDDNFLVPSYEHNRERVERLRAALDAQGVRDIGLVLKCAPRDADRRILTTLRKMGLLRIFMGIESGSQCGLDSIGRRQTVEQSERALALCEELGISSQYTMIILNPDATVASMLADLDFVGRHPAHPLNYCRAEIYAGTPLEARMLREGRAVGDYLGRTYRYSDEKVALVWEKGRDLFAGRCWGQGELLGGVIRLDHQVAVLGHFYEGRKVRELVRSFQDWEVEVNLETAAFFRELVLACAEASGTDDPVLARALADLRGRELAARALFQRRLCDFRQALEGYARSAVESGRRLARGDLLRGPRHAAAVAVAIGFIGCAHDQGVAEAPPPPIGDRRMPEPVGQDAGAIPPPNDDRYRDDPGVAEAAPPPLDLHPPSAALPDAGAPPPRVPRKPIEDFGVAEMAARPLREPDAGVPSRIPEPYDYREDYGVAEAAPPPLLERIPKDPEQSAPGGDAQPLPALPEPYRKDQGVAEAPPPPLEPLPAGQVRVSANPPIPLWVGEKPLEQGAALRLSLGARLRVGPGKDPLTSSIEATLDLAPLRNRVLIIQIQSTRALTVRGPYGSGPLAAPTALRVQPTPGARTELTLEDPRTSARVVVSLSYE